MELVREGYVPVRVWFDSEKQPHHFFLVNEIGIDLESARNKANGNDAACGPMYSNDNKVQMYCKVILKVDTMKHPKYGVHES